jgi:hypothetical protein
MGTSGTRYSPEAKGRAPRVSLGCTVALKGQKGQFIPIVMDAAGRWVGHL